MTHFSFIRATARLHLFEMFDSFPFGSTRFAPHRNTRTLPGAETGTAGHSVEATAIGLVEKEVVEVVVIEVEAAKEVTATNTRVLPPGARVADPETARALRDMVEGGGWMTTTMTSTKRNTKVSA